MDSESKAYKIVITEHARQAFFDVATYFLNHFSAKRSEYLLVELLEKPVILIDFPRLGSLEPALGHLSKEYRHSSGDDFVRRLAEPPRGAPACRSTKQPELSDHSRIPQRKVRHSLGQLRSIIPPSAIISWR
jgi:plasmid stabilization system protein ParE